MMTYNKISFLVMNLLGKECEVKTTGLSLAQMNSNIYSQMDDCLSKNYRENKNVKIDLGEKIVPMTIYAYFITRDESMKFIKELQKECGKKCDINPGKDCRELNIILSGIVKLVCIWEEPTPFMTVIRSFIEHALPIEAQAVMGLDNDLESMKEST